MNTNLFPTGQTPPLGVVPELMHAWVVREERFGEPVQAWRQEVLPVPTIADDEVLVYVMAAGINYNNVWAGMGSPISVIDRRRKAGAIEDFHIGGSDASGIVWKVGNNVTNVEVGDEVVVHCGTWPANWSAYPAIDDPMFHPEFRIWGYETNYGSFAQFTRVQAHQCLAKPRHLSWAQAGSYMLVGATAYRMLMGWGARNIVQPGSIVLIWGGAGGLGSMATQIVKAHGGLPICVVSRPDKAEYCRKLGAIGVINRKEFNHWGHLPQRTDKMGYTTWLKGVRAFGTAIWESTGKGNNPHIRTATWSCWLARATDSKK